MHPTPQQTQASTLADILARGRLLLQQQQAAELQQRIDREAAQQQRDRQHWRECRAVVCRDLPPCLIQHSNLTAEPPEGWTGGVEESGLWAVKPTREFVLVLNCPDCAEVGRVYSYNWAGQTGWHPSSAWLVPTHEIRQGDGGLSIALAHYCEWPRHDDLAIALAEAWVYRTQRYADLLAECERLNAELDEIARKAEEVAEPTPLLSIAEQLRFAIELVVCAAVRPECLQDHDPEDR